MVLKYREGVASTGESTALDEARASFVQSYHQRMEAYLLHDGLEAVFGLVRRANAFVDESEPWQLAKLGDEGADALDAALGSLVRCLRAVAALLGPFMPERAAEIWSRMGGDDGLPSFSDAAALPPAAASDLEAPQSFRVRKGPPVFPRFEA